MARELNIRITADNSQAKPVLTETEQGVRGIEGASKKATEAVGTPSGGGLVGSLSMLAKAAAGLGLVAAARSAIAYGSDLQTAAERTGLTVQALQRLDVAGAQSGISLDRVTASIQLLQKNLVTGNTSAVSAVAALGLNLQALKSQSPETMFETIASAIVKIPDPAERSAIAMQLFGRSGGELIPLMNALQEISDTMPQLSARQVAALDAFDDGIARAKVGAQVGIGTIIGYVADWRTAWDDLNRTIDSRTIDGMLQHLNATIRDQVDAMSAAVAAGVSYGRNFEDLVPKAVSAKDILSELVKQEKQAEQQARQSAQAAEAYSREIGRMADQISGRALAVEVRKLGEAMERAGGAAKVHESQVEGLVKKLHDYMTAGVRLTPVLKEFVQLHLDAFQAMVPVSRELDRAVLKYQTVTREIERFSESQRLAVQGMGSLQAAVNTFNVTQPIQQTQMLAINVKAAFDDLYAYYESFRTRSVDLFGQMLSGIESAFAKFGSRIGGLIQSHVGGPIGTALGGIAQGVVGIIGSIVSGGITTLIQLAGNLVMRGLAAIGRAIGGFFSSLFGRNNPNNDRDIWMASLGGLEGAHRIIQQYGNDPELMRAFEAAYFASTQDAFLEGMRAWFARLSQLGWRPPGPGPQDPAPGGPEIPEFATGTRGRFLSLPNSGIMARLHDDEAVVRRADAPGLAEEIASALAARGSGGGMAVTIQAIDVSSFRDWLRFRGGIDEITRALPDRVRDYGLA